jgi:3-oxoacyl-[acyl-carrier-protein] synthase-3
MGTILEATATTTGSRLRRGGRRLTLAAARAAIAGAELEPDDVDLLVNAGLYHDRNLGEPAFAALLQEDFGANPEDPHAGHHGTFSFDVANGAAGVLSALQIADGFLRAGTIRHALVVAGDSRPGRRLAPDFPFAPTGAAVTVGWSDRADGLVGFAWVTSPDDAALFDARVGLDRGRNALRITSEPTFGDRAALWAGKAAASLLAEHGLTPGDIDLVVAAPLAPDFLGALAPSLGFDGDRLVSPRPPGAHTTELVFALDEARRSGRLSAARAVLLVAAGAGINAGAALLHNENRTTS